MKLPNMSRPITRNVNCLPYNCVCRSDLVGYGTAKLSLIPHIAANDQAVSLVDRCAIWSLINRLGSESCRLLIGPVQQLNGAETRHCINYGIQRATITHQQIGFLSQSPCCQRSRLNGSFTLASTDVGEMMWFDQTYGGTTTTDSISSVSQHSTFPMN